jgi:hypothetical protein
LSFFKSAFACASLIMVTLTWNIKTCQFLHLTIICNSDSWQTYRLPKTYLTVCHISWTKLLVQDLRHSNSGSHRMLTIVSSNFLTITAITSPVFKKSGTAIVVPLKCWKY